MLIWVGRAVSAHLFQLFKLERVTFDALGKVGKLVNSF